MEKCSKCGSVISDNDNMAWKCTECGKAFRVNLSKLKKLKILKDKPENAGKTLLKCSACGNGIDNGNEKIACKCSVCGNVMMGKLEDFAGKDTAILKTESRAANIPVALSNISNNFIKCRNCGNSMPGNSKFCPECGHSIVTMKMKKSRILKIALICIPLSVCLISCIIFIVYRFTGNSQNLSSNFLSDLINKENATEKNFDNIILAQDTFELGDSVDLLGQLKYDTAKIIDVSIDDDGGFNNNKCGDYKITFQFTDKDEHSKKIPFQISVIDTTPPELSLPNKKCYLKKGQKFSIDDYATATDKNGIKSIDYNGELNLSDPGKYIIQVTATDNNNNVSDPKKLKIIVKDRTNCDIRNAKFGDSQETVIQYEDLKTIDDRDSNTLCYQTSLNNESAYLIYFFNDDDKLYGVVYRFTNTHTNNNYYISSYFDMVDKLSKKYGDPSDTEKIEGFTYSVYNDDAEALKMGALEYQTYWETKNMDVTIALKSDNHEILYFISYFSTKYHETMDHSEY